MAFLLYCLYMWYIAHEPTGNVEANDITAQLIVLICTLPVLILFYSMKMVTTIDEIGIHYQFFPFHITKKTIRWGDMVKCYVRKYNPISEYGGWGLRGSFGTNKAYNVKGNMGIPTVLQTTEKVLIGTQKAKEAKDTINYYLKLKNEGI